MTSKEIARSIMLGWEDRKWYETEDMIAEAIEAAKADAVLRTAGEELIAE